VPLPVPSAAPPAVRRRAAARIGAALVVTVLAGPLLAGCSALIPGRADDATASAAPATASPSRPQGQGGGSGQGDGSGQLSADACQVTVNGPGSVRVSGASSRVTTINGASSLSCDDGPVLDIGTVADGAVALSADGAAPVRIAAGQSASVGSYKVSVSSADGAAAQFVVEPG
jgi:hypothetical protein